MQQAPMPPEGQQESASNAGDPLTDMIMQTDQALAKITQVIGKQSPEAGQALQQINAQYREIISAVMNGGGGSREASPMVSPETHGKKAMQAY